MKVMVFLTAVWTTIVSQDFIFPDTVEKTTKTPTRIVNETQTNARIPVLIPGRCPPNELLYPAGTTDDWICDCGAGFLWYPPKDGCFQAFRQGPCESHKYLALLKNNVTARCVQNPCSTDGFVKFRGKCYELDKPGAPCGPTKENGGIFGVNSTTLELDCLKGGDALSLISVPSNCPKGSKRGANHCRQPY